MKEKSRMNSGTKRVIVVLIAIALIIFLIGLGSCSQRMRNHSITSETTDIEQPEQDYIDKKEDENSTVPSEPSTIVKPDTSVAKPSSAIPKDSKQPLPSKPNKPTQDSPSEPNNPTEISEPSEPDNPTTAIPIPPDESNTPDKPGNGGSDNNDSYPAAVVEIIAPEYSHVDAEFEVLTSIKNVKSLEWTVSETGNDTEQDVIFEGTLSKKGGKITIAAPGIYKLTAAAKNYGGRSYTFTKSIVIHSTHNITVNVEPYSHTDQIFEVKTNLSKNMKQKVNWSIYKDGHEMKWSEAVMGTLTNTGGMIQIVNKGVYMLKATVYDETSREFFGKAQVIVLPVVDISLKAPTMAHTDTKVALTVDTKELGALLIKWNIIKDGTAITPSEFIKGELNNNGGDVRFKDAGKYEITATATDKSGRVFTDKAEVKVYPVAVFSFSLPETAHTDTTIPITVTSENLQKMKVEWKVLLNGESVSLSDVIDGALNNEGGNVRFKSKGSYVLKASLVDETGREYNSEASTAIYPVAETGFYLPPMAHTDTKVHVKTLFKETDGMAPKWSLTKDGNALSLSNGFDGTLSDNGGIIRFRSVGNYELSAEATDITGRNFTYTVPVTVYPVINVSMTLAEQTHTDHPVSVSVEAIHSDALPVSWSIKKDGISVNDVSSLTNEGGTLSFTVKGIYTVTAAITDKTGRTFSDNKNIRVYPVPNITFDLAEAVHTDDILSVNTTLTDMEGLTAKWYIDNTFGFQDWETYVEGKLDNHGGSIRFKRVGLYDLQARVTDPTGRVFLFNSGKVEVLPVLLLSFELPDNGYTDTLMDVHTRGNNNVLPVEWTLIRNGGNILLEEAVIGSLNTYGGKIQFLEDGEYRLTASMTDALGRVFSHSETIRIYPLYNSNFSMPSSVHTGQSFTVTMGSDVKLNGKSISWSLLKDGENVVLSDFFKGSLDDNGGTVQVDVSGSYILTAAITDDLDRTFSTSQTIDITNTAPTKPTLTADVTRKCLNGKFLVNLTAVSTDPDGDTITYEYQNKANDDYYPIGTHTVQVRAKDDYGGVSDWAQTTFTITNSPPTTPVITRTPSGNSVAPGTAVTIKAASSDSDGDAITYVWEGRNKETQTYPLGKNIVRVKAVDSAGAESSWAAIIFFVADPNHGGGMTLTGPESTIIEDGVEGATITSWTYTVPAVEGHNASYDYGQIRGYNKLTGRWEQLKNVSFDSSVGSSFAAEDGNTGRVYTNNGVHMYGKLQAGIYTKLEFYYYTPHDCMYNKSNITYSVDFYFE